jgi:hypothetical protein
MVKDVPDADDTNPKGVAGLEGGGVDLSDASKSSFSSWLPSLSSRWMPDLVDVYDKDEIEEGDQIFIANIHPKCSDHFVRAAHVRATQTVSQRLAEAFAKNSNTPTFFDLVPSHLHDFEDVFSKESFNS